MVLARHRFQTSRSAHEVNNRPGKVLGVLPVLPISGRASTGDVKILLGPDQITFHKKEYARLVAATAGAVGPAPLPYAPPAGWAPNSY